MSQPPETTSTQTVADPRTGRAIPLSWQNQGASAEWKPAAPDQLRMGIAGPVGEGKTTFLRSCPSDTLILDFEDSCRSVPGGCAPYINVNSPTKYKDVMAKLLEEGKTGNRQWRCIAFDTVTSWVRNVDAMLASQKSTDKRKLLSIKEYGKDGAGYTLMYDRIVRDLAALSEYGYSWILVFHVVEETIRRGDKNETVIRVDMYPGLKKQVFRMIDVLAWVSRETKHTLQQKTRKVKLPNGSIKEVKIDTGTTSKDTYRLEVRNLQASELKGRVWHLPEGITLPRTKGWNKFAEAWTVAIQQTGEEFGLQVAQ